MDAPTQWQSFLGGVRHKLAIGAVVGLVGLAGALAFQERFAAILSGIAIGMGVGLALIGLGERG
jgi:hypothetical protein